MAYPAADVDEERLVASGLVEYERLERDCVQPLLVAVALCRHPLVELVEVAGTLRNPLEEALLDAVSLAEGRVPDICGNLVLGSLKVGGKL